MGQEKTTTTIDNTQKVTPTAEETRKNQLDLQLREASQAGQMELQQSGLNLSNLLLKGSTNLPGFFGELGTGINQDVQNQIVQESLRAIRPGFQSSGLMDSGTAASIEARTAGDIYRSSAEYNMNNKFNLLNLAFGGQAQIQQPLMAQSSLLSQSLAGLRTINTTGTTTTKSMNPFLKSFQTSLGNSLGSGSFGSAWSPTNAMG